MLHAKYYERFIGDEPCLLIIGDADSYNTAADYFLGKENVLLLNEIVFSSIITDNYSRGFVLLTRAECSALTQHCRVLAHASRPLHIYFDAQALPDVEIILSFGEYPILP